MLLSGLPPQVLSLCSFMQFSISVFIGKKLFLLFSQSALFPWECNHISGAITNMNSWIHIIERDTCSVFLASAVLFTFVTMCQWNVNYIFLAGILVNVNFFSFHTCLPPSPFWQNRHKFITLNLASKLSQLVHPLNVCLWLAFIFSYIFLI